VNSNPTNSFTPPELNAFFDNLKSTYIEKEMQESMDKINDLFQKMKGMTEDMKGEDPLEEAKKLKQKLSDGLSALKKGAHHSKNAAELINARLNERKKENEELLGMIHTLQREVVGRKQGTHAQQFSEKISEKVNSHAASIGQKNATEGMG